MKKILLLTLIFISPLILDSCFTHNESYEWIDMEVYNLDNSDIVPQISNSDSISKDIYGIRVEFIDSLYAYNSFNTHQLYAAVDPAYNFIRQNNINSIRIFTVFELTDEYSANTDITDLFRFRKIDINNRGYSSNSEIISMINSENLDVGREGFDSFLLTDLVINRLCKFRVEVELSNNRTLSYETEEVTLY